MIGIDSTKFDAGMKVYKEGQIPPPSVGKHVFEITRAVLKQPDGQTRYLLVQATVDEGDDEGKRISKRYYFDNEVGLGHLIGLWFACGLPQLDAVKPRINEESLIGKKFIGTVADSRPNKAGVIYRELGSVEPFVGEPVVAGNADFS